MDHNQRRDQHFWACITMLIGIFVGVFITILMLIVGMDWGIQICKHTECKIQKNIQSDKVKDD